MLEQWLQENFDKPEPTASLCVNERETHREREERTRENKRERQGERQRERETEEWLRDPLTTDDGDINPLCPRHALHAGQGGESPAHQDWSAARAGAAWC